MLLTALDETLADCLPRVCPWRAIQHLVGTQARRMRVFGQDTSTNLGITNVHDGQMELACAPRSSVDSELEDVSQMIASVWELAGHPVELVNFHKGWNPDPQSPILGLMQESYRDLYGQEPEVTAVHAGLDCGAIGAACPEMDLISIGPTLKDVHSLSERLFIPSVEKVMALLSEVLQRVPEQ